ncbi:D12 class N6 adenine-specific DNA methyltransferase [Paracoccus lutimaris]|uniref:D12 class N6 adenine-specific DNA methyltransferase n=1 Tax=Paracoccus lutimaris TaxID=1490030 RepID=A0A368YBQ6_9RHOB|nr:D12 class N6 adenine-specific DNA methyltransferase [Paracoccus lutimaris]
MPTQITPTAPVAPWLGGKRNLARRICAIIDATPCVTYAEPFVGMGGIFLRRTSRPRAEVINDRGRDIANLFRILQRHYPQFLDTLRFQLTTRAEFERLVQVAPDTLTDLERAARFLYLQRTAFGGKVCQSVFEMLGREVCGDQPAQGPGLRLLGLQRIGQRPNVLTFSKECRAANRCSVQVDLVTRRAMVATRLAVPVLEDFETFDADHRHARRPKIAAWLASATPAFSVSIH